MTFLTNAKNTVSRIALSYRDDTKGNFATIFAVSLFVLVAGVAAAVDLGAAASAKQRLQDTTDQISLYSARSLETDPAVLAQQAQDYVNFNYPNTKDSITIDNISRVGDAVRVEASTKVDTRFANILGFGKLDVNVLSVSNYAERGIDIALVLDTTGSMGQPSSGGGTKIETLRTAATNLISTLDTGTTGRVRVSVVPFAQYVNVGTDNLDADWIDDSLVNGAWGGCVGSRGGNGEEEADYDGDEFPAITGVSCSNPITPLTADLDKPKAGISTLLASGWTYMPSGLAWGWRTLEGNAPFTQADTKEKFERDRYIVMMTDGANTRANSGTYHDSASSNKADRATEKLCDAIKGSDIQIYSIAYEIDKAKTRRLLQGCASETDMYFNAQNADDLSQAFAEIASNLSTLRLTN